MALGYKVVNLGDMLKELGEELVYKKFLSEFSCPHNLDVEIFLKEKAVEFVHQGLAGVHLVFTSYRDELVLCGYFAIATKMFTISAKSEDLNSRTRSRISRFATYDDKMKRYHLYAPLIGQLGKNFANGYNKLITGDELLKIACDEVRKIHMICGGKFVYLECEDNEFLKSFYQDNGFVQFGKRPLDPDEENIKGSYLIQMLRYLG